MAGSVATEGSWMKKSKVCLGYALGPSGEVQVGEEGTELSCLGVTHERTVKKQRQWCK